jgi:IS5 family transposase
VLCAAGYNIRWLLRMIDRKGVTFLLRLYLRLCSWAVSAQSTHLDRPPSVHLDCI